MGWGAPYGADAIQQFIRQRLHDQIAEKERQRHAMNDDREFQMRQQEMEQAKAEREQARQDHLAAGKAAAADQQERRILSLSGSIKQDTPVGASLSQPAAGILQMTNPELVKTNPDYAFPPELDTASVRDTNIGEQPGQTYTGTGPQQRQIRVDESAAEDRRRNDARATARDAQLADQFKATSEENARHNRATEANTADLRQAQADAAAAKADAAKAASANQAKNAQDSTQSAMDLLDRLMDPKDLGQHLGAATGKYEMRGSIPAVLGGDAQGVEDFNAVRVQLVNALALPNLGALKGPMSDKDILFVKNLATRLGNTNLSESETKKAMDEARAFLEGKGAVSKSQAPSLEAGMIYAVDPQGVRHKAKAGTPLPAGWKLEP